ncbi:MAG: type secretion system and ImpA-related domain protein [Deltaproteobacteria bacterium]|nr:type secretion system and ImpA-related domain protein [Deltaproteobacteria bacterium]
MLGVERFTNSWDWTAFGKHPALKDFFRSGPRERLVKSFAEWVRKGFQMTADEKDLFPSLCSWRFWVRGPQKEMLACGLLRDSSDSLGRRYPLFILGSGVLEDWEEHWDLLPLACETSWAQMEYLSIRSFLKLKELEKELRDIQPPRAEWTEMMGRRGSLEDSLGPDAFQGALPRREEWETRSARGIQDSNFFLPLNEKPALDDVKMVNIGHFFLRKKLKGIPNAVFIGGTLEKTFLGVFNRPLLPADFKEMWTIASKKE